MILEQLVAGLVVTVAFTLLSAAPLLLLILILANTTPHRRRRPPVNLRREPRPQENRLPDSQTSIPCGECRACKTPFYRRLDENWIRLFILEPGEHSDPLRGRLIRQSLQPRTNDVVRPCGDYDALSYVWGRYSPTSVVHMKRGKMKITANLESALRFLRSAWSPRALWIDAICIDQSNSDERYHQISLMPDIYQYANKVHMWLGEEGDHVWLGMKVLSFLAGTRNLSNLAPWTKHSPALIRSSLDDILGRKYFTRTWVVQEAALSRRAKMAIGRHSLTWDAGPQTLRFVKRLKFVSVWPQWQRLGLDNINFQPLIELLELSLRNESIHTGRRTDPPDVLDLMYDLRHRQVTDPRDKIYALLRLVPDADDFRRDYGLTVDQTYEKLYHYIKMKYSGSWLMPTQPSFWQLGRCLESILCNLLKW